MTYQLLTFDLDGTLADTAGEIAEAANRTIEELGFARRPVIDITNLIGRGTRELMTRLLSNVAHEQPALKIEESDLLHRFERHYSDTTGTTATLFEGCKDGLDRLRAAGVAMACVTNKEHRFALRVLQVTGLLPYFGLVVGGDSLPEKKPHPSMIGHCLNVLGGEPHACAHVGDSHIDVATAHNAGVAAWAVPYGYNGGEPIESAGPHRVFPSIAAIADHVLALRGA
jgi:phosphoglycolate phosphatase